jgi:hypothetical protein
MDLPPVDCFVCRPGVARAAEAPYEWSWPTRALCVRHKVGLTLEDGQALKAVLGRVQPPDQQLEGGPLGWIYNPVFVAVETGPLLKGWTDWAAGGMAVFEDRFSARDYFEFSALELPGPVDFLYTLRCRRERGFAFQTARDLFELLLEAARERAWAERRGPVSGHGTLMEAWGRELRLRAIRARAGRLWPESWEDLLAWIEALSRTPGRPDELGRALADELGHPPGLEPAFFDVLDELAHKRFPEPSHLNPQGQPKPPS